MENPEDEERDRGRERTFRKEPQRILRHRGG